MPPPNSSSNQTTLHNNNSVKPNKNIFVTVGTTQFDKLVDSVTTTNALQWMQQQGYTTLTIQYGRGKIPSINFDTDRKKETDLTIDCYDFASSLEKDMKRAHLIISHAGAGTVMEALKLQKKLVVVINTDLMDNHQMELASAMYTRGLLWMVTNPEELNETSMSTWHAFEQFVPLPHQEGDEWDFPRLLDSFLGYHEEKTTKKKK
jgi:beta-1,4-N-acetylglucosaminyltransferase